MVDKSTENNELPKAQPAAMTLPDDVLKAVHGAFKNIPGVQSPDVAQLQSKKPVALDTQKQDVAYTNTSNDASMELQEAAPDYWGYRQNAAQPANTNTKPSVLTFAQGAKAVEREDNLSEAAALLRTIKALPAEVQARLTGAIARLDSALRTGKITDAELSKIREDFEKAQSDVEASKADDGVDSEYTKNIAAINARMEERLAKSKENDSKTDAIAKKYSITTKYDDAVDAANQKLEEAKRSGNLEAIGKADIELQKLRALKLAEQVKEARRLGIPDADIGVLEDGLGKAEKDLAHAIRDYDDRAKEQLNLMERGWNKAGKTADEIERLKGVFAERLQKEREETLAKIGKDGFGINDAKSYFEDKSNVISSDIAKVQLEFSEADPIQTKTAPASNVKVTKAARIID